MGGVLNLIKVVDTILFIFFGVMIVSVSIVDTQTCFPADFFPQAMVDLKLWYIREYDDYLYDEKPPFFMGLIWLELLFQWPLAIANFYAIFAAKSWFPTTSLIYGASFTTTMVAILAELILSKKGSERLLRIYVPLLGCAVLAMLRGLATRYSGENTYTIVGRRTTSSTQRRA